MRFVSDQPSETFPLAGLRILVTRQDTLDSSLSRMLEYKGASVLKTPMTQIRPPTSWESFDKAVLQEKIATNTARLAKRQRTFNKSQLKITKSASLSELHSFFGT